MTLRTRAQKGSALTHNELDANFKKVATQKTGNYTVTVADNRGTIEGNNATTPFTITLPTVANAGAAETGDFEVTVTNINAAVVSVDGNGAETINGSTDAITLKQWDSVTCQLDSAGNGWVTTARVGDLGDVDIADLSVTGAFTSQGIDDNATSTTLTIDASENSTFAGNVTLSDAATPTLEIIDTTNSATLRARATNTAADIGTTSAHDLAIISHGSSAITFDSAQAATFAGDVTVSGAFTSQGIDDNATGERIQIADSNTTIGGTSNGYDLRIGTSSVTTGTCVIEAGRDRTGDGNAVLDLIGDTTYTDYGLRLRRNNGGANTTSELSHRGTGNLQIRTVDGASMLLQTNSTTALTIDSSQNATFANDVTVTGDIAAANYSPPAAQVTGHVRAGNMQRVSGDGGNLLQFNVVGSLVAATWESVGPTGSGADNIWADLDDVPSSATMLIVSIYMGDLLTSAGDVEMAVYATTGDDASPAANNRTVIAQYETETSASNEKSFTTVGDLFIPINSSGIFELLYTNSGSGTPGITMNYRGFITD